MYKGCSFVSGVFLSTFQILRFLEWRSVRGPVITFSGVKKLFFALCSFLWGWHFTFSSIISPSFSLCCKSSRVYPKSRAYGIVATPILPWSYLIGHFLINMHCKKKPSLKCASYNQRSEDQTAQADGICLPTYSNIFYLIFPKCSNSSVGLSQHITTSKMDPNVF